MAAPDRAAGGTVCLGVVTGPHGVRGQVRIRPFTEVPEDLAAYGPVRDEAGGRTWRVRPLGRTGKGHLIAALEGVRDRTAAEALRGTRLCVARDRLPPPGEDEFYCDDLVGLEARLAAGGVLGRVRAVNDFGAGDVIEVVPERGPPVLVPFTRLAVPTVDVAGGFLVVDPPPGLLEPASPEGEDD